MTPTLAPRSTHPAHRMTMTMSSADLESQSPHDPVSRSDSSQTLCDMETTSSKTDPAKVCRVPSISHVRLPRSFSVSTPRSKSGLTCESELRTIPLEDATSTSN